MLVPVLTLALSVAAVSGACAKDRPARLAPAPGAARFTSTVDRPAKLTSIEAGQDSGGQPVGVACVTCHALRQPGALPTTVAELREFHVGLSFSHGVLTCSACHVQGRVDVVHLADGALVPLGDVLRLCSQCHGPQARDFAHGAHGGMSGHWDLSAGPRFRNNCVSCHDPHAPRYPGARPAPGPRDRGVVREGARS